MNYALSALDMFAVAFGSWRTGLSTPSSDMDFVAMQRSSIMPPGSGSSAVCHKRGDKVTESQLLEPSLLDPVNTSSMSRRERSRRFSGALRLVGTHLRSSAAFCSVQGIPRAKVPIVKALHRGGKRVDVSFLMDGVKSTQFLCEEFKKPQFSLARGIIILVKALVASWSLGDPSVGGLGSFPISIMVLWFLHAEAARRCPPEFRKSYAVCLVKFLKYYAREFDYRRTAIDYANKRLPGKEPTAELCIINPLNPGSNCAAAATLFGSRVVPKFDEAYTLFSRLVYTLDDAAVDKALLDTFGGLIGHTRVQCAQLLGLEKERQLHGEEAGPQHRWETATSLYAGDPLGDV
ncbi:DNA polymerase sigma-like protein [Trypanosoma conorhini]|uniref:DNA polymerase sigma-like protein n=1 Tax=Trypanosoma conorhini TaxID=83891 RepID=A0A422QBC2_9TRYP|nr:DNA polymerase sigma-like protein [Trypanosoma conorhini]RNF27274.1 DNA polymerase sigma-like protein [Trypanosoma conorhini]